MQIRACKSRERVVGGVEKMVAGGISGGMAGGREVIAGELRRHFIPTDSGGNILQW